MRVILTALLIAAPFVVLALASGKAEGAIWLMLPFVAAVPVFILVLVALLPAERLASSAGLSANLVVPIVGAVVGAAVAAAATYLGRPKGSAFTKVLASDPATWGVLIGVVASGLLVGVAWRASAWAVVKFGWD